MKKINLITLLFIPLLLGTNYNQNVPSETKVIQNGDLLYLSNVVNVKFKEVLKDETGLTNLPLINKILSTIRVVKVEQIFPTKDNSNKLAIELSKIHRIFYEGNIDPLELSRKIKNLSEVEYAEPHYVYRVDFTPNDPEYAGQYNLSRISASSAWDISKGDSSIVIGIVDTGIYWNHPDLSANIWVNANEIPNNGVDDDNNGYVDDVRGWDFGGLYGTPDNDPKEDQPDHGTHVAGIASASTNNGIGIASIGFKCKVMAVKTSRNDQRDPSTGQPYIVYGYEGIKYAADNGASAINCSWGGSGYSAMAQEVIDYASSKGSLVVAAAGNSGSLGDFFPASYEKVLSVASTNSNDTKSSFSNYGYTVDVCAPGSSIISTWSTNTYTYSSGTSMASPHAAGLAGLVKARYPSFTAEQVGEKIRVSCDDIYSVNPSYQYLLGKGRINALKALQDQYNESIRVISYLINDSAPLGNGNGSLEPNESANMNVNFKNILSPTSNLSITLTSLTSGITVQNGNFSAGSKSTGETFNNNSNPFVIKASSSIGYDLAVKLLLNFSDGSYSDFYVITFIANPSYVLSNNNNINLTIGSRGNLAFNDYPNNTQGQGMKYKSSTNLLFEGALIIGTGPTKISDRARGNNGSVQNNDFTLITPIKSFQPGPKADLQTVSVFNDDGAGTSKIGIRTLLNSYSYVANDYSNFVLLHYNFKNTTTSSISNFHAGLYFDWDLIASTGLDDLARWDDSTKLGYVYNQPGTTPYYVGCGLVSNTNYHYRAILNAGGDGGWGVYDGFTDAEKWEALSGGVVKTNAGAGDISHVVASGPYSINPGDSIDVVFAIVAGDNLQDLKSAITSARNKWQKILVSVNEQPNIVNEFRLFQNFPNPFNSNTIIKYQIAERGIVNMKIYDVLGKEIAQLVNENKEPGIYQIEFNSSDLPSGVYFYRMKAGDFIDSKKLLIIK